MCHSEPPTGVRNPYRDALQRIAVGISRRFAPRNYKLLCIIHAYPELRLLLGFVSTFTVVAEGIIIRGQHSYAEPVTKSG